MDERFKQILDKLPEVSRSSLEPYRELINQLRRRGRTYRQIAQILATECHISPSASTVYRFLHSRARTKLQVPKPAPSPEAPGQGSRALSEQKSQRNFPHESARFDDLHARIEALKRKPISQETEVKVFHYNPDEPLRLVPESSKTKEKA